MCIQGMQVGNLRSCNLYCWAFTNTVKEIRVIPLLSGKRRSDLQTHNWYKIHFPGNRGNNLFPFMLQRWKLCLGGRQIKLFVGWGVMVVSACFWMPWWRPREFNTYLALEILRAENHCETHPHKYMVQFLYPLVNSFGSVLTAPFYKTACIWKEKCTSAWTTFHQFI